MVLDPRTRVLSLPRICESHMFRLNSRFVDGLGSKNSCSLFATYMRNPHVTFSVSIPALLMILDLGKSVLFRSQCDVTRTKRLIKAPP